MMFKTIKIEDEMRVDYRVIYQELNIPLAGSIDSDIKQEDFEEHYSREYFPKIKSKNVSVGPKQLQHLSFLE